MRMRGVLILMAGVAASLAALSAVEAQPAPREPFPLWPNGAPRALRLVRARAAEWKLDPKRIGIMGSSAGGHLASTLLTHFDAGDPGAADPIEQKSSRPDLGILCYPVITMGEKTHGGSKQNL